ncbi:RidA family protein [Clostridium sp. E02]|uniref:RidA family protein n=1 Tax=Clostridium sp. E02 TaxID=2487134 RepID=UPI00242E0CCD|nr:RidA family protein [Clostridium sp. E02]
MKKIETDHAPAAIGPYSQAYISANTLYTSGQIPICPSTGAVVGTSIAEQAEQVMKNLGAILFAAGSNYKQVIKTTCYLADMKDFTEFNRIYETYFTEKPARSCVAVKTLPKDVLCEVELIAEV